MQRPGLQKLERNEDFTKTLLDRRDQILPHVDPLILKTIHERASNPCFGFTDKNLRTQERFLDSSNGIENVEEARILATQLSVIERLGGNAKLITDFTPLCDCPGIDTLKGVKDYPIRGLAGQINPKGIVIIPEEATEDQISYINGIRKKLGLPIATPLAFNDYDQIRAEVQKEMDYLWEFYRTPNSPDLSNYQLQELFENKNNCMMALNANGIKIAPLIFCGTIKDLKLEWKNKLQRKLPFVAKVARSAGGLGVKICKDLGDFDSFVDAHCPDTEIQIQEFVAGYDCSVQYYIDENGAYPISHTDQIIKGVEHQGNIVFSQHLDESDIENTNRGAYFLYKIGYRGDLSFDQRKPRDGRPARIIEPNLRAHGVSAAIHIATQLGEAEFSLGNVIFKTRESLLKAQKKHLYDRKKRKGMVPYMISETANGEIKTQLVAMGPPEQSLSLINTLKGSMAQPRA